MSQYIRCPVCKKTVACFIPRGGDGSGVRPRKHVSALDGCTNPCEGYYAIVDVGLISGTTADEGKKSKREFALPDYNPNGTANPKGDAAYWRTRAEAAEARAERYERWLQRVDNWAKAYPLDVFPEPDFRQVYVVLKAAGISLDQVSASNMRHVIKGVEGMVEKALKGGEE